MRDIGMCNLPSEPASVTAEFKHLVSQNLKDRIEFRNLLRVLS